MSLLKKYFLFFLFIHAFIFADSQQIKKMNAEELAAFILKSDKPLVISFWATWCGSCVEEIPYFISTIKGKYKTEIDLVLVSLDVKSYYPQKITAFVSRKNFDCPIVWMNESNADIFCPKIDSHWSGAIPSTLMVNNKKQYRKFYETGLTAFQFEKGLKELMK